VSHNAVQHFTVGGAVDEGVGHVGQCLGHGAPARARQAGLKEEVCNHTFRGTGITTHLENGGEPERAADMANHADTRTTRLYDRRNKQVTTDDVSRIRIFRR
jgi:integrase